ncbi:MAG: helicase C-terminal domain-containing protein [Candidatus Cloacimonadales bacterium]
MLTEFQQEFSFVALDFKTTGLKPESNNIVEIGATLFEKGEATKSFHSYIQPTFEISSLSLASLDVSLNTLKRSGQPIKSALSQLADFVKDHTVLFFNDFNQSTFLTYHIFNQNLTPFIDYHYDLYELMKIYYPFAERFDLEELVSLLNVKEEIDSNCEKRANLIGQLFYQVLHYIADKVPYPKNRVIYQLLSIAGLDSDLSNILVKVTEHQQKTALIKTQNELPKFPKVNFIDSKIEKSRHPKIEEVLGQTGLFSKQFPNYEEREGQIMMANSVEKAFEEKQLLLVEAGTGVGKSFAYLIPAINYSTKNKCKIVISTNTKNLQEQLFFKDIPTLAQMMPVSFKALIVKGRENYICLNRWQETILNVQTLTRYEAHGLLYLVIWQSLTQSGDISENNAFEKSKFQPSWRLVASERYFCGGMNRCPNSGSCHVMFIKKKLDEAGIVVVNHSLLLSDLMNERKTLGEYSRVIIDEAHNLPSVAGKHLGFSLTYFDLNQLLNHIVFTKMKKNIGLLPNFLNIVENTLSDGQACKSNFITIINSIILFIEDNKREFTDVFDKLGHVVEEKGSYGKHRIKDAKSLPSFTEDFTKLDTIWNQLLQKFFHLTDLLKATSRELIHNYDKYLSDFEGIYQQLSDIHESLNTLAHPEWDDYALWLEQFSSKNSEFPLVVVNYAPIEVKEKLHGILYNAIDTLVMTSATLAIRGVFKFFLNQSGLTLLKDRPIEQIIVPSPFEYNKQSKLFLVNFLPFPKDSLYVPQCLKVINMLITQTKQGSMVLFTSYKDLNYAFQELQEPLYEQGIKLLAQGISGSRNSILNEFKRNKNSVLLGTSSFWEGVDVQGESLSQLIVFKLPFQVPSEPLVEAYIEKLEAQKKNSFMHYMLPNALLKVRQGFGRLIRSKQDRGVVIILDKRVVTTRYGEYFKQILPCDLTVINSDLELIDKTNKFFNQM